MSLPQLVLDGARIHDLESFYDEVERVMTRGARWGRNLDAFHDILRGGFGTPDGGFVLVWQDSLSSQAALGSELFETLVDIVREHGPAGPEAEDNVRLRLD